MKPDHELLRFKKGNLFSILAFDHRGSFIESMQKHSEKKVEPTDAIRLKNAGLTPQRIRRNPLDCSSQRA
jgi:hypothetical protein